MKKGSLFLIIVVCIISVVVISFFGTKVEMGQFQTYMTSLTITNETKLVGNTKYFAIDFDDVEGYASVLIEYSYTPDDATYPDRVKFTLTNNTYVENEVTKYYATVSSNGEVVFYKRRAVTLTITTTDGSQLSDSVMIICK